MTILHQGTTINVIETQTFPDIVIRRMITEVAISILIVEVRAPVI